VLHSLDKRLAGATLTKERSVGHQHRIRTHNSTHRVKKSSAMLVERADGQAKLMTESADEDELDRLPILVPAESSTESPFRAVGGTGRIKRHRRRQGAHKDPPPTVGSPKPASSPNAENESDCSQLDLETIELDALAA